MVADRRDLGRKLELHSEKGVDLRTLAVFSGPIEGACAPSVPRPAACTPVLLLVLPWREGLCPGQGKGLRLNPLSRPWPSGPGDTAVRVSFIASSAYLANVAGSPSEIYRTDDNAGRWGS